MRGARLRSPSHGAENEISRRRSTPSQGARLFTAAAPSRSRPPSPVILSPQAKDLVVSPSPRPNQSLSHRVPQVSSRAQSSDLGITGHVGTRCHPPPRSFRRRRNLAPQPRRGEVATTHRVGTPCSGGGPGRDPSCVGMTREGGRHLVGCRLGSRIIPSSGRQTRADEASLPVGAGKGHSRLVRKAAMRGNVDIRSPATLPPEAQVLQLSPSGSPVNDTADQFAKTRCHGRNGRPPRPWYAVSPATARLEAPRPAHREPSFSSSPDLPFSCLPFSVSAPGY
jgi:hypothetical protein